MKDRFWEVAGPEAVQEFGSGWGEVLCEGAVPGGPDELRVWDAGALVDRV